MTAACYHAAAAGSEAIELLILANSFKHGGRCIAGKRLERDRAGLPHCLSGWVRPVPEHQRCDAMPAYLGRVPLLSCFNLTLGEPGGHDVQPENRIATSGQHYRYQHVLTLPEALRLPGFIDTPADLWLDEAAPTNACHEATALSHRHSLYCVSVEDLEARLCVDMHGKTRYRASFTYHGVRYREITITDQRFIARAKGTGVLERPGRWLLTLSLTAPWNGHGGEPLCYKLVAGVLGTL